ncbi:MAG: NfeD family protein [bacterium]|nr:NfeD family protein [bacterium]
METHTIPWLWLFVGVVLMLMEILAPGFVIFFFGLAAATLGVVLFIVDLSATLQIVSFTALCILYLLTLRRIAKSVFMGKTSESNTIGSEYVGRIGKVVEAIRPEVPGRILLGDAEWAATAGERLEPETEVRVVGQANLTLTVEKI